MSEPRLDGVSRRALLLGAGATGAAGLGAAALVARGGGGDPHADGGAASVTPVPASGAHQAGVDRPGLPQQHCLVMVADLDTSRLRASLAELGDTIRAITDPAGGLVDVTPDGPRDLTVTVGLGAEALAATAHPALADAVALPEFAGDAELSAELRGGALLLSVNASDPTMLEPALAALSETIAGLRVRWTEFGFRGTPVGHAARNALGYLDGIIVPRTEPELREAVWIADGPLAGGTICVIRRFRLDVDGFRMLPPAERDAAVGRVQGSGAPLSGGARDDQIDLAAKHPDGTLLVPSGAHARAAHPSFTGSPLMLRRSYGYRTGDGDQGQLFVSFQHEVDTFVRTQLRLDERDELMTFATPTATGAFAILPGMVGDEPLGAGLF